MARLFSIAFLAFFLLTSAAFFVIAMVIWLLTLPFDRRLVLLHYYTCLWASFYLWALPHVRTTAEGRAKIRKEQTYVIVSNHQSAIDILVAFRLFVPFKWVSKAENFRIPFIGWNMWLNRYIKLERGTRSGIRRMLEACERTLRRGSSIYLFPEGTRSMTGEVGRFRSGAFVLAQNLDLPVLPVVIHGTKDVLPKHSLMLRGRHHLRLQVLDEIPPDELAGLSPDAAGALVRERIVEALGRQEVMPE